MSYRFHAMQSLGPSARPSTVEQSLDYRSRHLPALQRHFQAQTLLASLRASVVATQMVPRRTDVTVGTSLRGLFGGFGDAGADLNAAMTQVVVALRQAYAQGRGQLKSAQGSGILDWLVGSNDTEASITANYDRIGPLIDKLDTTLRQQVLSGQKPDGTDYTLDDWKSFAKDIGSDIKSQTGYAWDSSGFNVLEQTASATGAQVKRDVTAGLGLAAVGAGAVGLIYVLAFTSAGANGVNLFKRRPKTAMAGFAGPRRRRRKSSRRRRH